jgi:2-oxoglutarate ferredoxin oxidoreductase subunit delta
VDLLGTWCRASQLGLPNGPRSATRSALADVAPATYGLLGGVDLTIAIERAQAVDVPSGSDAAYLPLEIAVDLCKGCGLCVDTCPKHVLALDSTVVNALGHHPVRLIEAAACTSCVLCARVCPDAVFTVYARPKGKR